MGAPVLRLTRVMKKISILAILLLASVALTAEQPWQPVGPDGGSVRSLAYDPRNPERIFLGTSAGNLYLSLDSGTSWSRLARLGSAAEMVLDHIVIDPIDPRNIFVAAWNAQLPNSDGDLFRSRDAGKTWEIVPDLHGKSLRALSLAPSNPRVLVVGALDGIYGSRDGGRSWKRISPENHAEIKNIESLAIDPVNPDVIYAGTWHLPWKTEDGGLSWHNIKTGVIDDSDVFSIIIDSIQPAHVFMSACSGIYRSESAGALFRKIQGIPYSARRTRMLRMDPSNHNIVYAGTTEGLWKTVDSGATWKRMTGANIVVNDVLVDPGRPSHVLLATDRGGVLASDDGGVAFTASNRGFTHRQAAALLVDRNDSATLYAGVLNDREYGGVFISRDSGHTWKQMSEGLDGHDIFVLRQASDDSLIAGTDHGIFQLKPNAAQWTAGNPLLVHRPAAASVKKVSAPLARPADLNPRVSMLELTPRRWIAATSAGLFVSADSGDTWRREYLPGVINPISLNVAGNTAVAASRNAIAVSFNGGESWLPSKPIHSNLFINEVAVNSAGEIWVAAFSGLFRSTDEGNSWRRITSLPFENVLSVQFDEDHHRILVTSPASNNVFESSDNAQTWNAISAGWQLRNIHVARGRILATTDFDGVVVQPEVTAGIETGPQTGSR